MCNYILIQRLWPIVWIGDQRLLKEHGLKTDKAI